MKDEGTRRFDRSVSVSEPQAAANPHKLRWYQYRLRTLLLLVLVVSVALSDLSHLSLVEHRLDRPRVRCCRPGRSTVDGSHGPVRRPLRGDPVGIGTVLMGRRWRRRLLGPRQERQVLLVHHCRRMHKKVAAFLLKLRQQIPKDATDSAAAVRREQANSADEKRLQGEWEVVACESDGRPVAGVVGTRRRYEGRTCTPAPIAPSSWTRRRRPSGSTFTGHSRAITQYLISIRCRVSTLSMGTH